MSKPLLLVLIANLILLTGCGKKAEERPKHTPQEIAFIRDCLAVGLRPTVLLDLESKAIAEAQGSANASGPTKTQLKDLRVIFADSAAKLNEMAASPTAGRNI